MTSRGRVLVLGEDTRSFLAIVRSLGRGGIEVDAAPGDFTSPALASRYLGKVHRLPPYVGDGSEWCEKVTNLLRREGFDLVIPCDERTILPFDRHRESFVGLTRLALPEPHVLSTFFDKEKTRQRALACDIPVAPGRLITAEDDPAVLTAEFGLPLVLKPARSYRLESLHARGQVEIFGEASALTAALGGMDDVPMLAERYFAGQGAGVSILASNGRVLQAFQHARARERGGAGFYRVSQPLSPDLLTAVRRMAGSLGFTGIAMFEFKIARDSGQWILLEVNARPWGSMPLALAVGVDFPHRWYRLLVAGEETPHVDYPAGIFGRNLLPDARQILAEARDRRRSPGGMIKHLAGASGEFRRLLVGREHMDVLVSDDPKPGLVEIGREAGELTRRSLAKMPGRRWLLAARDRRTVRNFVKELGAAELRGPDASIVAVCQGNICRSPVAAELLRRHLGVWLPQLHILSAGMLAREGASSPEAAVAAADEIGIDLRTHRSSYFSERLAEMANLIVIFDQRNHYDLGARYPGLLPRAVMLGSFLDARNAPREIADPDGCDLATFRRTYALIADAALGLAAAIRRDGGT